MIKPTNAAKYAAKRDEVLAVACALDDLPDNPTTWTPEQQRTAHDLILRLGGPESFLRRFARNDLA
jgi:hypothetical protein